MLDICKVPIHRAGWSVWLCDILAHPAMLATLCSQCTTNIAWVCFEQHAAPAAAFSQRQPLNDCEGLSTATARPALQLSHGYISPVAT